jgi:hypothetical protein
MKAICKTQTKVEGNKITITGELIDVTEPLFHAQRFCIQHPVNGLMKHPRQIQANSNGVMVKRPGADGVLFPKDEMAAIAIEIDRKLTSAPMFVAHPHQANETGTVRSEIPLTARIESSADGKTWTEIPLGTKHEKGKFYRCVAVNDSGETASNHFKAQ